MAVSSRTSGRRISDSDAGVAGAAESTRADGWFDFSRRGVANALASPTTRGDRVAGWEAATSTATGSSSFCLADRARFPSSGDLDDGTGETCVSLFGA
jgi:hypothetical protein